jgi:hypothetical protein
MKTTTTTYSIVINGRAIEELSGIQERRFALIVAAQRWERNSVVVVMAFSSDGKCSRERLITAEGKFK